MSDDFEWDEIKAAMNFEKHGVAFSEAKTVFGDPLSITISDPLHSKDEDRYLKIGLSADRQVLVVDYTTKGERQRIIQARRATPAERRRYMKGEFEIRDEDELLPEYDFSQGVRGLHYLPRVVRSVSLDEDVAEVFKTSSEVNAALRSVIDSRSSGTDHRPLPPL